MTKILLFRPSTLVMPLFSSQVMPSAFMDIVHYSINLIEASRCQIVLQLGVV
uniref:Uncharacterized protein n=1 Tax=Solanum tuberosum TaxID=4113 RepID=M1BNT2_SOLTU